MTLPAPSSAPLPFRSHTTPFVVTGSPLLSTLNAEWVRLNSSVATAAAVRRWARTEPVLAGLCTVGEITDAIDAADHQHTDALMLALLRLLHSGHQLAGRVLLQAMLPKLMKTGRSFAERALRAGASSQGISALREEHRHLAVATFWTVAATYPLERRPSKVAANLAMDTVKGIGRASTSGAEVLCGLTTTDGSSDTAPHDGPLGTVLAMEDAGDVQLSNDDDLLKVIQWGESTGTLTTAEASLLIACYVSPTNDASDGTEGRSRFAEAARQQQTTQAAIRQRCSRASRKLAEAVRSDLAESSRFPDIIACA